MPCGGGGDRLQCGDSAPSECPGPFIVGENPLVGWKVHDPPPPPSRFPKLPRRPGLPYPDSKYDYRTVTVINCT